MEDIHYQQELEAMRTVFPSRLHQPFLLTVSTEHAPLSQDHATVDVEPHTPPSSEIEESAEHDDFCNPLGSESMSLDDTDTIKDESGSESSCPGRSECNLSSTQALCLSHHRQAPQGATRPRTCRSPLDDML